MSEMNIYQKMSAITSEISKVAKKLNVGYGTNTYKAVGEADVLSAVKPIEEKHGVYSYPHERRVISSDTIVSKNTKGEEKSSVFIRIETVYRFVNIDNPEEHIDIKTYGDGVDTQDKAPGKAMTYADKYALLKAYKIQTGSDPDQKISAEAEPENKNAYPERSEMISKIKKSYPEGTVRNELLTVMKKPSIEMLTDAQLKAIYNKVSKK